MEKTANLQERTGVSGVGRMEKTANLQERTGVSEAFLVEARR